MMVRMIRADKGPSAGAHIAYTQMEVDDCKKNGWIEESEVKKTHKKRGPNKPKQPRIIE